MCVNVMQRRSYIKSTAGIAAGTAIAGCLGRDSDGEYPSQPIEFIVPFGEGGGTDVYARQITSVVSDILDVEIQIDNQEGAASLLGTGNLMNAEPDGYTLGAFNPPSTPLSAMVEEPDWDLREIEGVCVHSSAPFILIANEEEEVEDIDDVLDRYEDGEWSSFGGQDSEGGSTHVMSLLMQDMHGMEWDEYIAYDGTGPMSEAVSSGEVPLGVGAEAGIQSAVEDGRADPVLVVSSEGSSVFPDVPTVEDEGLEPIDFIGQITRGFWAPPDTPDEYIETFSSAVEEAIESDEVQEWSEESDNPVDYQGPDAADSALQEAFDTVPEEVDLDEFR